MAYIPYGYRIENGKLQIDDIQARKLKVLYESYVSGMTLQKAHEVSKIESSFNAIKTMLKNPVYTGCDGYPQIIENALFESVQKERKERVSRLGKNKLKHREKVFSPLTGFQISKAETSFDDPKLQAEYLYTLIKEKEA